MQKEKERNTELHVCMNMYMKSEQSNEGVSSKGKMSGGSEQQKDLEKNIDDLKALLIQQGEENAVLLKERDTIIEQLQALLKEQLSATKHIEHKMQQELAQVKREYTQEVESLLTKNASA